MADGIPLDHVIARNLRELIQERGMTHGAVASWMQALGIDWSTNRVAQTVTLRRSLSLLEVAALCRLFRVPLDRLLAGDDQIALPRTQRDTDSGPDETAGLDVIRDVLRTGNSDRVADVGLGWSEHRSVVAVTIPDELEGELARKLGTDRTTIRGLGARLYGDIHISVERDRRTGDVSGLSPAAARAKRGHAMRGILAEMRARLAEDERNRAKVRRSL